MIKKILAFIYRNDQVDRSTTKPVKQRSIVEDEVSESDLTDEEQVKYAKLVQLVQMACRIAEGSLEGMDGSGSEDDIYESERFEKFAQSALSQSEEIQDDFYKSSALHLIADLLSKAGQYDRASKLIEQIAVEFIQEKATEFLTQQKSQSTNNDQAE